MTDYQISLLNKGGHAVSSRDARCVYAREALGLAQRTLNGRSHADVWAGTRRVGQVTEASGADIKALGQPWTSQPRIRA